MRFGRGGIVHDQLDDAGKLLDLEKYLINGLPLRVDRYAYPASWVA